MGNYKLGVIGGMGPKATSVFFDKVVECTVAGRDQDHINMIILNHATLPDRTDVIAQHGETEFLASMDKNLRLLASTDVSHIAIPCNTSHYFYRQLSEMTSVPIINMVEETVKHIHSLYGDGCKIGLLATDGTVNTGIYAMNSKFYNMKMHVPTANMQQQVMDIIYDVKANVTVDAKQLELIINKLLHEDGCDCIILACTELSCLPIEQNLRNYCVDALDVLVKHSILLSGKAYKGDL